MKQCTPDSHVFRCGLITIFPCFCFWPYKTPMKNPGYGRNSWQHLLSVENFHVFQAAAKSIEGMLETKNKDFPEVPKPKTTSSEVESCFCFFIQDGGGCCILYILDIFVIYCSYEIEYWDMYGYVYMIHIYMYIACIYMIAYCYLYCCTHAIYLLVIGYEYFVLVIIVPTYQPRQLLSNWMLTWILWN